MKCKHPIKVAHAKYRETNVSTYQNNPLILALPHRLVAKRFRDILDYQPPLFDYLQMSDEDRVSELKELRRTRIMTTQHLDLYNDLYDMMSQGYIDRNPIRPEVISWTYDIADSSIPLGDIPRPILSSSGQTTADAMFVTGLSGNGKTMSMEAILLNLFPNVIEHDYRGFQEPQILWLKVDMPHDGNRSSLIYGILRELDRALTSSSWGQSNYAKSVKKSNGSWLNIESMLDVLVTVLVRHHVGMLIVDEFQNLHVASQRYRDEVLQLFDSLSNKLAIPTIKIGTPDSILIFDKKGRHKRRIGAVLELTRFSEKIDWDRALKALSLYQPLDKPIEINESIDHLLKELTAGVPSILFILWESVLIEAIRSGKESISAALLKSTFKRRFPLMRTVVRNILQGKKGRHSDLLTVQQYLDSGHSTLAIKHLSQFSLNTKLNGVAAEAAKDDIEDMTKQHSFSPAQLDKLEKIKQSLDVQKKSVRQPQTIEHKK